LEPIVNIDDVGKDPGLERGQTRRSAPTHLPPMMTREEQIRLLNRMPTDYEPGASDELIKCINESRMNTETPDL